MKKIDAEIFRGAGNLKSFQLAGAELIELPATLFIHTPLLKKVRFVYLPHLDRIDADIFQPAKSVENIAIEDCGLTIIPNNVFRGLKNLRELSFARNEFTHVDVTDFGDCDKLETLNFQWNKITCLTDNSFDQLTHLKRLHLLGNPISRIDPLTFSKMNSLLGVPLSFDKLDNSSRKNYEEQARIFNQRPRASKNKNHLT